MTNPPPPSTARFPALAALGLRREQLPVLARQGSLTVDRAAAAGGYYKLRFRWGGRQQVRYVGNDPALVAQVERELAQLQADTRARRHLQHLLAEAHACLRRTKEQLAPLLPMTGRHFHGREIRRRRQG